MSKLGRVLSWWPRTCLSSPGMDTAGGMGQLDGELAPWATRAAGLKQVCLCCLAALICFPSACLLAWQALRRLQTTCCTVCAINVNEACPAALLVLLHVRDYACHGCGARSWTQCTHTNPCGTSYGRYTRLGGLVSAVPLVRISPPLYQVCVSRVGFAKRHSSGWHIFLQCLERRSESNILEDVLYT